MSLFMFLSHHVFFSHSSVIFFFILLSFTFYISLLSFLSHCLLFIAIGARAICIHIRKKGGTLQLVFILFPLHLLLDFLYLLYTSADIACFIPPQHLILSHRRDKQWFIASWVILVHGLFTLGHRGQGAGKKRLKAEELYLGYRLLLCYFLQWFRFGSILASRFVSSILSRSEERR